MSLKENFNQAIREILKKDGIVNTEDTNAQAQKTELDRYIEPIQSQETTKVAETVANVMTENEQKSDTTTSYTQTPVQEREQTFTGGMSSARPSQTATMYNPHATQRSGESNYSVPHFNESSTEETTVISRNTVVEGNIRSFANVTINGNVKGDVRLTKNADVSGKILGDLECNNASLAGSQMQGNILSKGQVHFDKDSLILGDVTAQYLDMNGKVKGNIEVAGKADFKSDAYIIGDINASTISVTEGATISGYINTTFLQENPTVVFPESIIMSE